MMRKMFLLFSICLLAASWALAQDSSSGSQSATPSNGSNPSANAGFVQGCLSGSDGSYMLTQDGTGTSFKLMGDETQLKKHVGHEVAITGQANTGDTGSAPASSQGQADASASGATGTTIQVSDVKMISKKCGSGGSAPQSR